MIIGLREEEKALERRRRRRRDGSEMQIMNCSLEWKIIEMWTILIRKRNYIRC